MLKVIFSFFSLFILFELSASYAAPKAPSEDVKSDSPPKTGNYILPSSQQPGSFISFGENILPENTAQAFLYSDAFFGSHMHLIDALPYGVYGITDNFSVLLGIPIAVNYKEDKSHSSGLSDMPLQFEYAFYNDENSQFADQATIVTGMTFPTGSATKEPSTGLGSVSFFIGPTFNRTYVDWFVFSSGGANLVTSHNGRKEGNSYLYEAGLGRNICTTSSNWLWAWTVEANGQYTEKSRFKGETDPDSGGNTLFITPSLFISSNQVTLQFGIGLPAVQHLFGDQTKTKYFLASNLSWLF